LKFFGLSVFLPKAGKILAFLNFDGKKELAVSFIVVSI
jgi:hypothetical protein